MNEMENLAKKNQWLRIKKFCYTGIVISLFGTLLYASKTPRNETLEVIPKSVKMIHSDGVIIFAITPTYTRPVQKAELTRLSHTFRLVPNLHWIVVEDAAEPTELVGKLLKNSGLPYTHLVQATPASWKIASNVCLASKYSEKGKDTHVIQLCGLMLECYSPCARPEGRWKKPRGVLQRNAALKWIRKSFSQESGVIYFADDDNTYSLELFEEMRKTKKVSIWPVGLVGGLLVEKPLVEEGKVIGFNAGWRPERKFPIDMAGFAVSLQHFLSKPKAQFSLESKGGFQETDFLDLLTTREELEPMAANCTKILVWHTRSEKPTLVYEDQLRRKGLKPSNYGME